MAFEREQVVISIMGGSFAYFSIYLVSIMRVLGIEAAQAFSSSILSFHPTKHFFQKAFQDAYNAVTHTDWSYTVPVIYLFEQS